MTIEPVTAKAAAQESPGGTME